MLISLASSVLRYSVGLVSTSHDFGGEGRGSGRGAFVKLSSHLWPCFSKGSPWGSQTSWSEVLAFNGFQVLLINVHDENRRHLMLPLGAVAKGSSFSLALRS